MLHRYDLVKNFPNGDRYRGEATECNVKDGRGTFSWGSSGATYTGEWKKDAMHGRGVWTVPDVVDGFVYEGTFINGARHGTGSCRFNNGRSYNGLWANNAMHDAQGVLQGGTTDGFASYTGPFEASLPHGAGGTMLYRNGDTYHGAWHKGMRHGRGRFESPTAHPLVVLYEGTFDHDACCGEGRVTFRDGTTYEGQHKDMVPHGQGLRSSPGTEGGLYLGEFRNGLRHGRGALETSTFRYDGTWDDDARHGLGEYWRVPQKDQPQKVFPSEGPTPQDQAPPHAHNAVQHYSGAWHRDAMAGPGKNIVTYADGCIYEGDMADNEPSGAGSIRNMAICLVQHCRDATAAFHCTARLHYSGAFAEGVPHGHGEGTWLANHDVGGDALDGHEAPTPQCWRSPHGTTFSGAWCNGLPHGNGRCVYACGATYEGSVSYGLPHGEIGGTFTWAALPALGGSSNAAHPPLRHVYKGGFDAGRREHKGRLQFANGDVYDGEWHMDARCGHGTFYHSNSGDNYTGAWRDDRFHGEGKQIVYGTAFYQGGFACGKRHGHGTLSLTNGSMRYEGGFADDVFEGQGTLVLPAAGLKHVGSFSKGQCHGVVQTTHDNGNIYHGAYVDGATSGNGEMRYANGDYYVGSFASDERRHGRGVFYFSEGTKLECTWVHNVLSGTGTHTDASGRVSTRTYVDGTLVVPEVPNLDPTQVERIVLADTTPCNSSPPAECQSVPRHVDTASMGGCDEGCEEGGDRRSESQPTQGGVEASEPQRPSANPIAPTRVASLPSAVPLSLVRQLRGRASDATTVPTNESRIQQLTQSIANLNQTIQNCEASDMDDTNKKRLELLRASRIKEARDLLNVLSTPTSSGPVATVM